MREHLSTNPSAPDAPAISDAKRKLLEKLLRGEMKQEPPSQLKISPRSADTPSQLSFAQERLWFLDQLNPGSAVFNVPLTVRLSGPIDSGTLARSVNEVVRRHEILRTTFVKVDGRPQPLIKPSLNLELPVIDLADLPKSEREAKGRALLREEEHRPFDLARGPLVRTRLWRLDDHDYFFQVNLHHIVSDGWSLVLFFKELSAVYQAYVRSEPSPLAEISVQYADYALWQRDWLQGGALQQQLAYWKEKLAGELPVLNLPTDHPRPAVRTYPGAREWLVLSEQLTSSLTALAQREGATLFMTMLAAFKVLLYRYTGQEDVIVGSPIANRPQAETEKLIGFFLNNLALRSDLSGNPAFREVLSRVRTTALEAFANQDVPFEKLIEVLKPERSLSQTSIFEVYFNLFNFTEEVKLPGSDNSLSFVEAWAQSDEDFSKIDLTLYAGLCGRELKLALVYNTDLFTQASITRFLGHFGALLEDISAHPDKCIADLTLRTQAEAESVIRVRPTNAFTEFRREEIEKPITERFAQQVAKYPQRIAVKSKNHEWTYEKLDSTVNRIAQSILRLRGDAEERIALLFGHDAPMIAGMLGALKAGKTYVPLDPNHPRERLAQIIEDSQATALLTNSQNFALADALTRSAIWSAVAERSGDTALDHNHASERKAPSPLRSAGALQKRLINIDDEVPTEAPIALPAIEPDRLAYILYTSGSTGQPKGVMQNHRNVLHYIRVYTNNLHLNEDDRLTLLSSYCFDAAVMDIYSALLNGATLYPIDLKEDGLADLSRQLVDERITVYHSTPTVYRYFINTVALNDRAEFPDLRLVVLGGENVTRTDVELYQKHFSDECLFVNGLGPTEATVALQNFIAKQTRISGDNIPVGFPVADTDVLLLDKDGMPAAVSGEIAIKSAHVALGYWRNPEATTTSFPTNGNGTAGRIYRTGDMGRRLPDGNLQFEGRKDLQVKIRGFRVELGEIESALTQHQFVRESVVVAKENAAGEKRLVAYVVPHEKQALIPTPSTFEKKSGWAVSTPQALSPHPFPMESGEKHAELRDFLRQKLPEYMVPSSFVVIDSLPLTRSGKLDRRALPAPNDSVTSMDRANLAAPETELEKSLTAIWADILEVKAIGINDNFFDLGGHSLLAVRLFAQIEKKLSKRMPLATLFQAPTVAQLAAVIQKDWTPEWSSLVPIQPSGSKAPFFCVHALGGNVLEYRELARHLGEGRPFYGLQSAGLDGKRAPHTRVEDMATHYIKEMRELQPTGPYFIGGRSLGGMVAFEMAQQLLADGEEIGLLALLDTYPSGYAKILRDQATLRGRFRREVGRIKAHLANLRTLSVKDKLSYLVGKSKFAPRKMKSQIWRRVHNSFANLGRPLPRALQDIKELNSLAVREYVPQIYGGYVTLFWASSDLRASVDFVEGWRALAGGSMEVHEIPGTHLDIVKEPHVSALARKLSGCLENAQAKRK